MMRRLDTTTFLAVGAPCTLGITTAPQELVQARRARFAALAEIEACERVLTRFDEASDLCRANAGAGSWVEVDRRLVDALEHALLLRVATGGRCDPTLRNAAVGLDRAGARIRLAAGTSIGLGATGKGWLGRRALAAARTAWPGLPGALVDLGGDLAVTGAPPEGGPWLVDVEDPRSESLPAGTIRLRRGGVATSGPTRRRLHLIDPGRRAPYTDGPLAATAVSADPAAADAHATALALLPVERAGAYVAAHPGLGALVVPRHGEPLVLGAVDYRPRRAAVAT